MSLLRFPLPVAGVNSKETPEPRSYTLIHELIHIMLAAGKDEAPAARESRSGEAWLAVERFAEEATSHTLVPEEALSEVIRSRGFPRSGWDVGDVRSLAKQFRISPLAMATRLRASGFFDWTHYRNWKDVWDKHVASLTPRKGGFAHPIAQTLSRAGRPFTQVVLEALASNRITPVNASRYLDLKFEHFEKLRGALREHPGAGGGDE